MIRAMVKAFRDNQKIERAKMFAHEAHDSIGQIRKYTGEPYWVHTDAVALTVALHGGTTEMVCAAHLHDVLEDVVNQTNMGEFGASVIFDNFGYETLRYVIALTDVYTSKAYPQFNRAERKRLEAERMAAIPKGAKLIKIADLLDNTESIVAHDPGFARTYLREKKELLKVLECDFTREIHKIALTQLEESFKVLQ